MLKVILGSILAAMLVPSAGVPLETENGGEIPSPEPQQAESDGGQSSWQTEYDMAGARLESYLESLEINPRNPIRFYALDARHRLLLAKRLNPERFDIRAQIIRVSALLQDFTVSPDHRSNQTYLQTILNETGEIETRGIESFEDVSAEDLRSMESTDLSRAAAMYAEVLNHYGIALERLGELGPAYASYTRAFDINPRDKSIFANLLRVFELGAHGIGNSTVEELAALDSTLVDEILDSRYSLPETYVILGGHHFSMVPWDGVPDPMRIPYLSHAGDLYIKALECSIDPDSDLGLEIGSQIGMLLAALWVHGHNSATDSLYQIMRKYAPEMPDTLVIDPMMRTVRRAVLQDRI